MTLLTETLAGLICILLLFGALTDIAYRTIPDWVALGIVVLGIGIRLVAGSLTGVAISFGIGLAAFVILLLLHSRGAIGGGDVKLIAAVCVGLTPIQTAHFVFLMAMAGGVLALLHLAGRFTLRGWKPRKPPPRGTSLLLRVVHIEIWRLARHGSLPYGVAIACGGIWTLLRAVGN